MSDLYDGTNDYLMPDYEELGKEGIQLDLKERLLNLKNLSEGLLILGPPGIGKSTLMSWLCLQYDENRVLAYSPLDDLLMNM